MQARLPLHETVRRRDKRSASGCDKPRTLRNSSIVIPNASPIKADAETFHPQIFDAAVGEQRPSVINFTEAR
jgi:hypothetical protein